MAKFYTGIGSRSTPQKILDEIRDIAEILAHNHWILRSGGAEGADTAFEKGSDLGGAMYSIHHKEIYLPWKNFNNNKSELYLPRSGGLTDKAFQVAKKYHPSWDYLRYGAKLLHARNCFQVLGWDLKTLSQVVICYTEKGLGKGGTGQALRIAKDYNIPIIDLGNRTAENNKLLAELLHG